MKTAIKMVDLAKLEHLRFMMHTRIANEILDDIDLAIPEVSVKLSPYMNWLYDLIGVNINFYVLGQRLSDEVSVRYPRDWWEALKERFLPEWAKRRWPVLYISIRLDIVALRRKLENPEDYKVIARVFEGAPNVDGVHWDRFEGNHA